MFFIHAVHISLAILMRYPIELNANCIIFNTIYGLIQFVGFTLSYNLINNTGIISDTMGLIIGSGVFKSSFVKWYPRKQLHDRYIKTKLDPDKNYLSNFKNPTDLDICRQIQHFEMKSSKTLQYQDKFYSIIAIISGLLLPSFICYLISNNWKVSIIVSLWRIGIVWNLISLQNYPTIESKMQKPFMWLKKNNLKLRI